MAFHGDLSSYPLPELLQWLDSSRKTGALHLTWDAGDRKLFLLGGQVVATASPGLWERLARVLEAGGEAHGGELMSALRRGHLTDAAIALSARQLCEEDLIGALVDLTAAQAGRFHWTEDPDRGEDEWVPLELHLRHALFESLRYLDEGPDVERVLPNDTVLVKGTSSQGASPTAPASALRRVVLKVSRGEAGVPLGRLWLQLGLSRGVVTRAVYELLRAGQVQVDGAAELQDDPIADMLEKGAILVRERQFDAAGLVFAALLQRDPGDRRVREFARMVEREHAASLYRELPPVTTFEVHRQPEVLQTLRQEERTVLSQLELGWDVSSVILASPRRELDTLKFLIRLSRLGLATPRKVASTGPASGPGFGR